MRSSDNANSWLLGIYESRYRRNPNYSLRAFAKFLEIAPGRLSEIFNSRRRLTAAMATKIADRLALAPAKRAEFMRLVAKGSIDVTKTVPVKTTTPYHTLPEDQFSVIADWYHYAILSLFDVRDFQPNAKWVGQRLGLAPQIVNAALARLERLQLIKRQPKRWVLTGRNLTTSEDIVSPALRRSHRQSLKQAITALETVPVELRDISSITLAISLDKIQEAKQLIREFRRLCADRLETGKATEVYNLNIQFVPVTQISKAES